MPELFSHAIAIGLTVVVMMGLVGALNVMRANNQQIVADELVENVCYQIKIVAERLSASSQPSTLDMALPDRIGNEPYTVSAYNHTVTISSVHATHNCVIGTNVQLSGSSTSSAVRLTTSGNKIIVTGA